MKRRRFQITLSVITAVLLLLTAVIVFYDFYLRIQYHYAQAAAAILLRAVLLLALLAALSVVVAVNLLLAQREKVRRREIEQGRYYLLSHFANTYLFEYSYHSRQLTLIGNLPPEAEELPLGVPFDPCLFHERIHREDYPKVLALYEHPPAAGEEYEYEFRLRRRDGASVWYGGKAVTIYDNRRPVLLMSRFENIEARKHREASLIAQSNLDGLTGLLNRAAAAQRITEFIHTPCAARGGALLMLDLDDFKAINDTCGHASGDHALLLAAQLLRSSFRSCDIIARAGGDEFLVFLVGVCREEQIIRKAQPLCAAMEDAARSRGIPFTCSVGAALYPRDGRDFDSLYRAADAAMYASKRQGKNAFQLYSPENSAPNERWAADAAPAEHVKEDAPD